MAKNKDLFSSNIDKISIGAFSEDAYLNYSMYVICLLYTSDAADD